MAKKLLAILLTALFCVSALLLTACNDPVGEGSADESAVSEGEDQKKGFLPEKKDWGGETVSILLTGNSTYSTSAIPDEASDEPVVNAFYKRNALIEQEFGIKLNAVIGENYNECVNILRNDIDSGLGEIQASSIALTYIAPLGVDGMLYDFSEIENGYIHYNEEWWDQTALRDLSINNRIWFLTGDAMVADDESTWAMYFNKDIINNYRLDNPFDLVRSGDWTLDKFYEMACSVQTMNGSKMSYDPAVGDVWGAVVQSYDFFMFMLGAEEPMIDATGDVPAFRVDEQENISTFKQIMDYMLDDQHIGVADFNGHWSTVYATERQIFCNGNALFMPSAISFVSSQQLRTAEIHYGLLPMPKRNGNQDDYSTSVTVYWCEVFSIPTSNIEKLDVTCYALEAMAYYGKEMVTPEYYDRTLKYKRFQDDDSTDMLDLIFRNRTYDLAGIFDFGSVDGNAQGSLYFYTSLLGLKSDDIMSRWEAVKDGFQLALEDLIAVVEAKN